MLSTVRKDRFPRRSRRGLRHGTIIVGSLEVVLPEIPKTVSPSLLARGKSVTTHHSHKGVSGFFRMLASLPEPSLRGTFQHGSDASSRGKSASFLSPSKDSEAESLAKLRVGRVSTLAQQLLQDEILRPGRTKRVLLWLTTRQRSDSKLFSKGVQIFSTVQVIAELFKHERTTHSPSGGFAKFETTSSSFKLFSLQAQVSHYVEQSGHFGIAARGEHTLSRCNCEVWPG